MPCSTCCGSGCSSCGTSGGYTAPPAIAVQREVYPQGSQQEERSWLHQVGETLANVWNHVSQFIAQQVDNDNIQLALIAAPMSATMIGPIPILHSELETLDLKGTLTRYPIEDRRELADHLHLEPKRYRIKGLLGSPNYWGIAAMFSGKGILDTSPLWTAKTSMLALERIHRDRVPVWLVSNLQIIRNAVITGMEASMRTPHTNVIYVELILEQALFGQAGDVEATGLDGAATGGGDGTSTTEPNNGRGGESFLGWIIKMIIGAITGGGQSQEEER